MILNYGVAEFGNRDGHGNKYFRFLDILILSLLNLHFKCTHKSLLSGFNQPILIVSDIKYQEQFKIRSSEIDANQFATLPAICTLLQEVAGNHAHQLNFDITDLQEDKLTWVLHRLNIEMERFPKWREEITIQTWPSSGDGLRAYRDFIILDEHGQKIGHCISYWLMMNIETRRPTRIPKNILAMAPAESEHVLAVDKPDYPEIEHPDQSAPFKVRKTDLDLNQHVNNVRYIEWALSSLPEGIRVHKLDIQFMAESTMGDIDIAEHKQVSAARGKSTYIHQIIRESDQEVLARGQSQ